MSKRPGGQNKNQTGRNVWIIVLVLILLTTASMAGAGSVINRLSTKEKNIISVSAQIGDYSTGTYHTKAHGTQTDHAESGHTERRGTESDAETSGTGQAASAKPGLVVYDDKVQWKNTTEVDLFDVSYANDAGEITVKSDSGDKVIAPGTANDYDFTLKNTGNISLDYVLSLNSLFALQEWELPIQVRLRSGSRWITGGENEWVPASGLKSVVEKGTLEVNQYKTYTLQWRWPFEMGAAEELALNDLNDTVLGNCADGEDVNFRLTITVQTEVTPGAAIVEENNRPLIEWVQNKLMPKTGDDTDIVRYVVLLAAAAVVLVLLLGKRIFDFRLRHGGSSRADEKKEK